MPDSVDHRVEMYQLARERRKAGKPVWSETVKVGDIFHNPELSFEQQRDQVCFRFRQSRWMRRAPECEPIHEYIDELGDTEDQQEFNEVFQSVYDEADYARIWIDHISA